MSQVRCSIVLGVVLLKAVQHVHTYMSQGKHNKRAPVSRHSYTSLTPGHSQDGLRIPEVEGHTAAAFKLVEAVTGPA
jgi:hypothetical protein